MTTSRRHGIMIALAACLCACESFSLTPPNDAIQAWPEAVDGEHEIVALVNSLDSADLLEERALRRGFRLVSRETLGGLNFVMFRFDAPEGMTPTLASQELEILEPHTTASVNATYGLQQGRAIGADETGLAYADRLIGWPAAGCRAQVSVGMIDGAVDASALSDDARLIARDFTGGERGEAGARHGTSVAELIAGPTRLRGATLYSANVVSDEDAGASAGVVRLIRALDWMARENVPVVNVSLAGPYNRTLDRSIQRASAQGVLLVAAVGNAGADAPPYFPAAFPKVVAVTAVDSEREIYRRAVRGPHVTVAAPGVDVFVPNKGEARYVSGTSIAAPFVTSLIAADAYLSPKASFRTLSRHLAERTDDLGAPGRDDVYGLGLIKAPAGCDAG